MERGSSFFQILKTGFLRGLVLLVTYIIIMIALLLLLLLIFKLWMLTSFHDSYYRTLAVSFVILAIIGFWITFIGWFPLIITTPLHPWKAFKLSFTLIKNNWWRTLGLTLLVFILGVFIYLITINLVGLLWAFNVGLIALALPLCIAAFFMIPWMICVLLLHVHSLKLQHFS